MQWISWEPSVWIYESAELSKRIAHLPLFSAHQKMSVNNVRELIQGGSALTAVRRCFLPVATDPQKFTYPGTSRNFNIPNTTRSIFNWEQATVWEVISPRKFAISFPNSCTHTALHTYTPDSACRPARGRAPKGTRTCL